jgi:hypothetical protein
MITWFNLFSSKKLLIVKRDTMLIKSSEISLNALQLVFRSSRSFLGRPRNMTFAMPVTIELQSATLDPR